MLILGLVCNAVVKKTQCTFLGSIRWFLFKVIVYACMKARSHKSIFPRTQLKYSMTTNLVLLKVNLWEVA